MEARSAKVTMIIVTGILWTGTLLGQDMGLRLVSYSLFFNYGYRLNESKDDENIEFAGLLIIGGLIMIVVNLFPDIEIKFMIVLLMNGILAKSLIIK